MSALVRITTGIMPNHSRVGMSRAMQQFGEVVHCHKPPYSGMPGEDFVNVRFGTQAAADAAYAALKANTVFVDGFPVGVGPTPNGGGGGGGGGKGGGKGGGGYGKGGKDNMLGDRSFMARRSESPPRRFARGVAGGNARRRSPDRDAASFSSRDVRNHRRSPSPPSRRSRSRSRPRERENRRYREERRDENNAPPPERAERNSRPARTPSPDPLGPMKNNKLVVNPFYRHNRSPSPEPAELMNREAFGRHDSMHQLSAF